MKNEAFYTDGLPEILPAYENGIFQAMLTLPEANAALVSAVSAFLDRPVRKVVLRSNYTPLRDIKEKQQIYDVNCVVDGENGDQCELEMQASSMIGDNAENEHRNIRWRSVLYLTSLHAGQAGKGLQDYGAFVRSYQVMLCNYKVFSSSSDSLVERFTFKNTQGHELCDAVTSIFIDLTKAKEIVKKSVHDMTAVEMWVSFIAYANDPRYIDVLEKITKKMEGIAVANSTLQSISQSPEARIEFRRRQKAQLDQAHNESVMRKAFAAKEKADEDLKAAEAEITEMKVEISEKDAEIVELRAKLAELIKNDQ